MKQKLVTSWGFEVLI